MSDPRLGIDRYRVHSLTSLRNTLRGAHPEPGEARVSMIRVICPHCSLVFLVPIPPDEDEALTCPGCQHHFIPDEEEWVDPEDE